MTGSDPNPPIACTLNAEQRAERAERLRNVLADRYEDATEREDGYTFQFDGSDETLAALATFVANERQCCSFAEYTIDTSPPYDETRLTITGPEGSKAVFDGLDDFLNEAKTA
ncbi:Zn-dependent oxidoreductase [Natrarchaeobius chitinivorans]|uniref:Zn-dependent oxidoreductase n=1 Tax=Natrarchaeobius chitinivorans TaxID=1679083 RepID=A0A3N6LZD5_NATCH|nr:Zn-dependent oxidoreductase [Natrarchaeobius chitinivorans]RQG94547.1 Zn-dependent oxidoreductase [Natrarchaeobius chitinivorans]